MYQTQNFFFRDNKGVQKNISKAINVNQYDIPLQACKKYVFAVAIIHNVLSDDKQLYATTKQIETAGKDIHRPKILSTDKGNLVWQEDEGDCVESYRVVSRYVCTF